MSLPRKLKNMNAYVDGASYLGIISEYVEPKLALNMEEYRGGGMIGPVMLDNGLEAMEAEFTMAGHVAALIRKFGTTDVDGVRLRLVGAYQADDGTRAQAVEINLGGRFQEIDAGTAKAGDDTEHKYKTPVAYYRRVVDGRTEVEIDMQRGIFSVDGIDRYAEIMEIISN